MGKLSGLSREQRRALARLSHVEEARGFYLAGGSALAVHLRHRRSRDLDLFSRTPDADLEAVHRALAELFDAIEVAARSQVMMAIRADGVVVDFVRYPYPPLEAPVAGPEGFRLQGCAIWP